MSVAARLSTLLRQIAHATDLPAPSASELDPARWREELVGHSLGEFTVLRVLGIMKKLDVAEVGLVADPELER